MGRTIRRGSKNFIPKTEPLKEKRKQGYNKYKGSSLDEVSDHYDEEDEEDKIK